MTMSATAESHTSSTKRCRCKDRNFHRFLTETGIGALLSNALRGHSNIRRIIWGFMLICCLIGAIVGISISISTYASADTTTTTSVTTETSIAFPAVTFCNVGAYANASDPVTNSTFKLVHDIFITEVARNLTRLLEECSAIVEGTDQAILAKSIWEHLSSPEYFPDFIHSCSIRTGDDNIPFPCKNDIQPVLTSTGVCYTFNFITNDLSEVYTSHTGTKYGLEVLLYADNDNIFNLDGDRGIKVIIHNVNDISRPTLYGIGVPQGRRMVAGVNKVTTIDETTQSQCSDGISLDFFPYAAYSQFACRANRLIEHIANESVCGCIIHSYTPPSGPFANIRNCTFNDSCCLIQEYNMFTTHSCPLPCTFVNYLARPSYYSFPNGERLKKLSKLLNISNRDVRDSVIGVQVFVENIQETNITTSYSYSFTSLLSDFGGIAGLYLGVSLISLLEIGMLIYDEVMSICFPKSIKKKIKEIDKEIELVEVVNNEEESNE